MTNYNERLDEILRSLAYQAYLTAHAPGYTKLDGRTYKTAVDEAKQAIASLTKELVTEAKPINKQGEIDIDEPAYNDGYYSGAYTTLEKFEKNLLKELEEV